MIEDENISQLSELKSFIGSENQELVFDRNIEKMAIALAKSLKDKNLRKTIKEEAMLKVDGDYDIVWKNFKGNSINTDKGQMEMLDLLLDNVDQNNSETYLIEDLVRFSETNKALQIAVPIHCEGWDVNNYIPLVTYLPFNYDENTVKEVKAFDSDGNIYYLNVDIEPENPVVVISRSERLDENGEIRKVEPKLISINYDKTDAILKSAPTGPTSLKLTHGYANSVILE